MVVFSKLLTGPSPPCLKVTRSHAPRRSIVRAAASSDASLRSKMSKTALRKVPKAALERMLSELGMDTAGNKIALIERLVAASEETLDQAPMAATLQDEASEEVSILRTELTRLQLQLAATTEQLEAASALAEAERTELVQMGSSMARLVAEHEEERTQLQAAEAAAAKLQQSCEEVESLRTRQADLAESIALMQSLLEERDSEIVLLKRQLEEFAVKSPVYAAEAAEGGNVAVAERPSGADWDIPSAWRPTQSAKPSLSGGVPFIMEEGGASDAESRAAKQADVTQKHGAPMMMAIAGAQTVSRAYMSVRRSLPQDYRIVMDTAAVAVSSTLLVLAAYA